MMKKLKTCLALVLSLLTIVVSVPVTSFAETYPEVESIEFEPLSFVEFTNGYYTEVYDYDADDYVKYYKYNDFDTNYTIVLKDGTVLEPDYWGDLEYNGSWYYPSYETDQSYENQWGVGTHTVNVTIMGFEASFDVIIEESFPF